MLPTYNEKENIEKIVGEVLKHSNVNIVIVDDSSPDGTGEIADRLASGHPGRIHVVHRMERGRGTAGIAGLRYAMNQDVDCVIEMDADLSHDPKQIPEFLEKMKDYDVVIGSRFVSGSRAARKPVRKLISDVARIYTQAFLGSRIRDWSGGYKCYTRDALRSLDFNDFRSQGYSIGMETLYRLTRKGFRCTEIPIEFTDKRRGKSKFSATEILSYMITVLKLRMGT